MPAHANIDLAKVEAAAACYATYEEIAAILNLSVMSVFRAAKSEAFVEAYQRGRGKCRYSLRRKQVEMANAGNATMLIWLGKQILGQRDEQHIKTDVSVTTSAVAQLTDEQVETIAKLLETASSKAADNIIDVEPEQIEAPQSIEPFTNA